MPERRVITWDEYLGIVNVIDRVKLDDRNLDTDEYAGMILDALNLTTPRGLAAN